MPQLYLFLILVYRCQFGIYNTGSIVKVTIFSICEVSTRIHIVSYQSLSCCTVPIHWSFPILGSFWLYLNNCIPYCLNKWYNPSTVELLCYQSALSDLQNNTFTLGIPYLNSSNTQSLIDIKSTKLWSHLSITVLLYIR